MENLTLERASAQKEKNHQTIKEIQQMKTLIAIALAACVLLALPASSHGETTKDGWFFALTKENAHKAAVAVGEPDGTAVLDQMVAAGLIYHMKDGLDVKVLGIEGGLVKFRLRGSIAELWTCREAINW